MPWPPTVETDFTIPLEWQLTAGIPSGLSPAVAVGTESGDTGLDPSTGTLAPGVMQWQDNPLDLLEELAAQQKAKRDALAAEDSSPDPLTNATGKRAKVIEFAKTKLGMPYVWGGESDSEGGYDCSGLLWYAFKKAGIDMPRVSMAQATRGKRVSINSLQPGDLVAFENNARVAGADHIALYLGDGVILEAPKTGLKIRIRKLRPDELQSSAAWGVKLDY